MMVVMFMKDNDVSKIIKNGGVGVIPTDTLYGLVASAFIESAVEKVYNLKNRDEKKSLIILISDIEDLTKFGVEITEKAKNFIKNFWPGKVSVIFKFNNKKLSYLDRMDGTLAFRLPKNDKLITILRETGPLVAPSTNPEGMPPAKNTGEAKKYFGEGVDFYIDGGEINSLPSTLVKIEGDDIKILREGAVKIVL